MPTQLDVTIGNIKSGKYIRPDEEMHEDCYWPELGAGIDDREFKWTPAARELIHAHLWTPFGKLEVANKIEFMREFVESDLFAMYVPVGLKDMLPVELVAQTVHGMRSAAFQVLDRAAAHAAAGDEAAARALFEDLASRHVETGEVMSTFPDTKAYLTFQPFEPATVDMRSRAWCPITLTKHLGSIVQHHYDAYVSLERAYRTFYETVQGFRAKNLPGELAIKVLVPSHDGFGILDAAAGKE